MSYTLTTLPGVECWHSHLARSDSTVLVSLEYAWVHQHHGRCRFHWFGQGKDSSGMTRQTPGLVPRLERQHRYLTAKLLACKCKKAVGDLPLFDTFVKYKHFLRRPCSPPWQMWRAVSFPSDFAARAREKVREEVMLTNRYLQYGNHERVLRAVAFEIEALHLTILQPAVGLEHLRSTLCYVRFFVSNMRQSC